MLIVGYILLFLLCLSTLVMVHEAGHLASAKIFKVYCFEYSVGFGPKLLKVRRKGGETYFSLRAIPFGGYVKMYGEDDGTNPEGIEIDPSRSLGSIKKWKRLIIMLAGVIMNAVLAIVIFFVYEVGFPKYIGYSSQISVNQGSLADQIGLVSDDVVYSYDTGYDATYVFYDNDAKMTYVDKDGQTLPEVPVFFGYNFSSLAIKDTSLYNHAVAFIGNEMGHPTVDTYVEKTVHEVLDETQDPDTDYRVSGFIRAIGAVEVEIDGKKQNVLGVSISDNFTDPEDSTLIVIFDGYNQYKDDFKYVGNGLEIEIYGKVSEFKEGVKVIRPQAQDYLFNVPNFEGCQNLFEYKLFNNTPTKISYSIYSNRQNGTGKGDANVFEQDIVTNGNAFKLKENPGINMKLGAYYNSYGDAVKNCFVDFGNAATLIGRGLGELFTSAESWQNVGGIIAVGVMTTRTLEENGFGAFLWMWAVISVNLAIINLLPFPGLDGWHCLVTIIEGVTHNELPKKFKTIMSFVGFIILFALMIAIVIKDLIMFI